MVKISDTFRAFSSKNYRLFFAGQSISLIGTWMQQVALSWYVYRLTGSSLLLGTIAFLSQIPSIAVSPFAGVIADRINRRHLLYATQLASMVQALILAVLVISGHGSVEAFLILSFIMGVINSVDAPVRQSFVVQLVDNKKNLSNAIALNSAMFNLARMIGPSVGGFMIIFAGEGGCFLINGLSYIAVLIALYCMTMPRHQKAERVGEPGFLHDFKMGLAYAYKTVPIRYLLILLAVTSFMGISYMTLMPVYVKKILNGDAHIYGILTGCGGAGALAGALYLASRKDVRGLLRITAVTSIMMSIILSAFTFIQSLLVAAIAISCIGFCMILMMGACNTIIQTVVNEEMRGRVMSLYTIAFMGFTPFGSLLMGWISDYAGPQNAVMAGGICCLAASLFFVFRIKTIRAHIRPMYIRLGIIPVNEER